MQKNTTMIVIASLCLALSLPVQAAEQLYSDQPTVTPELANAGMHSVGVTTIKIINPQQLNTSDFKTLSDRELAVEVWYPADLNKDSKLASYKNVTRSHQEFDLYANAFRNAEPTKVNKEYPLIVLSHGYTGYRTIMFYLGEHLASHGYVVASIDHTDSTNAEVDFATAPGSGFMSTLRNRARDQQAVLDYFGSEKTQITEIANDKLASVIGYSMGGYGAINTAGGCYSFSASALQAIGVPDEMSSAIIPAFNS